MILYAATKDLHHACEQHPVGQRMSDGTVAPQEWADWLAAFRTLHGAIDMTLPAHMSRDVVLTADLSVLPEPRPSDAARRFAVSLLGQDVAGAAYVLHGAHRSGGRVMAPKMAKRGFPTLHTVYRHPDDVRVWIDGVRNRADMVQQARDTFGCLLAVMNEIEGRRDGNNP
jgi:heme oxygenase